jgi:cell division initiation protein
VPLTPLDIHNREFRRGFRGYDEDEVDEFLDEVVRDYELVIKERDRLKDELQDMERRLDQYRQLEESLQKALVVAQKTAEEMAETARREADVVVRQARMEAEQILEEARAKVRQVEREWADRQNEMRVWSAKVRSLLESQLRLLAELQADGEEAGGHGGA